MDSKWIKDFLSLAETQNFSRAAAERYVTQPAFSRRIKNLELWVGATLFDRNNGPISLTPCGEKFREYAQKIYSEMNHIRADIRRLSDKGKSQVNILCIQSLTQSFLPKLLQDFDFRKDTVKILPNFKGYNTHIECLVKGGANIFICYEADSINLDTPLSPHVKRFEVRTEQLVPVLRAGLSEIVEFDQPGNIPFLGYTNNSFLGRIISNKIYHLEPKLDTVYETKNPEALLHMVKQGRGVAWLPYSVCEKDLREQNIRIMDGWGIEIGAKVIAYHNTEVEGPASSRLWDYIQNQNLN